MRFIKNFKEEIVEVRNAVAHQRAEVTAAGIIIKKKIVNACLFRIVLKNVI